MEYVRTVTMRVNDIGLLASAQLFNQRSLLQVRTRGEYERDRVHAGCIQGGDKRMLVSTRVRHDRDNHVVPSTRLARRDCEHHRLKPAHVAGSNDMKDCPPRTIAVGNLGAIYTYR
jgi:hypothetical protein